jgi:hypothetical protein
MGWAVQDGMQMTASSQPAVTNVVLTLYVHENNPGGPLISGVRIAARDGAGKNFIQTTDAGGCVTISGKPGNWGLAAMKDGYQPNSWTQTISATCRRDAFLQKSPAPPPVCLTSQRRLPHP